MPRTQSPAPTEPRHPSTTDHQRISALSRTCLFLLPILAALGPHLGGIEAFGISFFPYRIAVLTISFASIALLPRLHWPRNRYMRYYALLGATWIVWALLALLWARSQQAALRGAFAVAFGFLTFLAVANLESWKPHALRWTIRGWIAAATVTSGIAVWELATGDHLPGTWFSANPHLRDVAIAASFDNPNNFGVFILLTIPLLFATLDNLRTPILRFSTIFFACLLVFFSVITASRVAIYGIILVTLLYLLRRPSLRTSDIASFLIVAALIPLIPFTNALLSLLTSIDPRFLTTFVWQGSNLIRLNLALLGFDMLADTFGAGVGGHNFAIMLTSTSAYSRRFTASVVDPHNWWIEILTEYGVVIFFTYIFYLSYVYLTYRRSSHNLPISYARHVPLFFVAFIISGLSPSTFVNVSWQWLYIAIIIIAASAPTSPETPSRESPTTTRADPARGATHQSPPRPMA